jgi:hypothetical protein
MMTPFPIAERHGQEFVRNTAWFAVWPRRGGNLNPDGAWVDGYRKSILPCAGQQLFHVT